MRTKETDLQEFQLYIGGRSLPAESGATHESVNPYTGKPWTLAPAAEPER
jgi:aldehyde dehydrogenase (NAD+)